MANTTVLFTLDEGEVLANVNWLPLAVGETISFDAPLGIPNPILFFSPDLRKVFTPEPPDHLILGQSAPWVFTVTASQPGAYTIMVGNTPDFPPYFPDRSSLNLFFESMPPMVGQPSPVDPPPRSGN